jgi:hypothetical protein
MGGVAAVAEELSTAYVLLHIPSVLHSSWQRGGVGAVEELSTGSSGMLQKEPSIFVFPVSLELLFDRKRENCTA